MGYGDETPVRSELVKIMPQVLWVFVALYAFHALYEPALRYIDRGKVSELSVWNIQIKFVKDSLALADTMSGALKTPQEFAPFEERIKRLAPKIAGTAILWIDDKHPSQNIYERRAFGVLGMNIDMVRDTQEAVSMLKISFYDVIISDMNRPEQADNSADWGNGIKGAGCGLLKAVNGIMKERQPPTIIYSANFDPALGAPAYVSAITNRTDHLLQHVLDAVERRGIPQ